MVMSYLLHKQVMTGEISNVRSVLSPGVNLNELDELGNSPLHWAVMGGHIDIVELLLRIGADPNIMCSDGYTPKWSAADFGLHDIGTLLDSYGGKILTDHNFDNVSWSIFKSAVGEPMPKEESRFLGLMDFIKRSWVKLKN